MILLRRTAVLACAAVLAVTTVPGGATPAVATHPAPAARALHQASDVPSLRRELTAATAEVERLAAEVFRESARSAHLRRAMDALAEQQDAARAALDDRIRDVYIRGRGDPLATYVAKLRNPDLAYAVRRSGLREVRTDAELVADVRQESAAAVSLRRRAEALRRDLVARAAPALAAQDRARALLAAAEARVAADAVARAELARRRAALDAASRALTLAVAPAVTTRGRRAAGKEAPVVSHIEQHCCAVPPGYVATGHTIRGIASWYGPGFVGNPTATGAPYDPERLTGAMLAVPLGTVVRVTTAEGRAVVVLINDRGPYVAGRVIDLSRAGSRALGFDGIKQVTVEVLAPA
ncbi:MAG TPA: septal ring lytic transglycosylase RlpA family protein [Mycobacteriales bacterium]|nr:septal ring lytic transglycosylase RlpA family protein [Mycobacteriales bacterium]